MECSIPLGITVKGNTFKLDTSSREQLHNASCVVGACVHGTDQVLSVGFDYNGFLTNPG